jgi:hypothetical protein
MKEIKRPVSRHIDGLRGREKTLQGDRFFEFLSYRRKGENLLSRSAQPAVLTTLLKS